jgi:hypothetical protein
MTVEMSGVPDQSCLTITVTGLEDLTGNALTGDNHVQVVVLAGDLIDHGIVNIFDMGNVKGQLFQPITYSNLMADVNLDGVINIFDMGEVKTNLFHRASCP